MLKWMIQCTNKTWANILLALCSNEHTCARESAFFILPRNSNFWAINSFLHRLIFLLMYSRNHGDCWSVEEHCTWPKWTDYTKSMMKTLDLTAYWLWNVSCQFKWQNNHIPLCLHWQLVLFRFQLRLLCNFDCKPISPVKNCHRQLVLPRDRFSNYLK